MLTEDPQRLSVSVSLRHLKLFESVARLSSVHRASEECHVSQPAVTQAIGKLEERIGYSLFVRRASGSYLNEFGTIFQGRITRLFAQIEQALIDLGVSASHAPILASRITRSQIRSLISIVESGSFAQAARALGLSQASLNRAARDLERDVRKPLYHRTASGIKATPAGAEFARKLKVAAREIDGGLEALCAFKESSGGQILIGAMQLAGSFLLASMLNEFVSAHPRAIVRISTGSAAATLRSLRVGDVDLAIGLLSDLISDDLIQEPLAVLPYVVVARHGHPLFSKRRVTLDDLADYDWVVGTPGSSRLACFETLFAGRRKPQVRIVIASPLPLIRLFLARSDCLALLTSYELTYEDALAALPFGPIRPVPSVGVITRENWSPTQLQMEFLHLIRKRAASLMPKREPLRAN
jgi:LysR family transcriptional regulator, regulator for genes of the gallate degradation pathway